jgi:hypothetical protein
MTTLTMEMPEKVFTACESIPRNLQERCGLARPRYGASVLDPESFACDNSTPLIPTDC